MTISFFFFDIEIWIPSVLVDSLVYCIGSDENRVKWVAPASYEVKGLQILYLASGLQVIGRLEFIGREKKLAANYVLFCYLRC